MRMMLPENNGEWKFLSREFDKRSEREKAKSNKNVLLNVLDNHQKKKMAEKENTSLNCSTKMTTRVSCLV